MFVADGIQLNSIGFLQTGERVKRIAGKFVVKTRGP
jgi:hypothetical protein